MISLPHSTGVRVFALCNPWPVSAVPKIITWTGGIFSSNVSNLRVQHYARGLSTKIAKLEKYPKHRLSKLVLCVSFFCSSNDQEVVQHPVGIAENRGVIMTQQAIETLSTFGVGILCIVLGIIVLAVFFKVLSWLVSQGTKPETMAVRGVLKKDTWATVHMQGEKAFERVRFIGFTNTDSIKTHLPYDLHGMVILEDQDGTRFLVRAKAIRMIVIAPTEAKK